MIKIKEHHDLFTIFLTFTIFSPFFYITLAMIKEGIYLIYSHTIFAIVHRVKVDWTLCVISFSSGGMVDKFGVVSRKSNSEFGTDFACAITSELKESHMV